jgi:Uma2 family endonuclease
MKECVLVDHRERRIELFRRTDGGAWAKHVATSGQRAELLSIGCRLDVDEIYRGIALG